MTRDYKAYFIDLDGTIYRGKQRIPSAETFIHRLQQKGIPFLFLTNNATKSPEQVAESLKEYYQIETDPSTVVTSGVATVNYLLKHGYARELFVIGEKALKDQLLAAGFCIDSPNPKVVVQGVDWNVTYQQLERATLAIHKGAQFITTNTDTNVPTERGLIPGSGSITAFLKASTGVEPIVIGKPSSIIMETAVEHLNQVIPLPEPITRKDILMVGDNYNTDIMAGIKFGMDTLMVLTGISTRSDVQHQSNKPTYIMNDLDGWDI